MKDLTITSPSFSEGGFIPKRHSPHGEDLSPALILENLSPDAQSIAVTLDDTSHPLFGVYNHWLIWNIPVQAEIPEGIPHGKYVTELHGAVQGLAYGFHRYKGPKPPLWTCHSYQFTVYALDCRLELPASSRKKDLLSAMQGHIIQQAALSGQYRRR